MNSILTATASPSSPSLLETNRMSNLAHAPSAATAPRGLAHLIAAVTGAIEAAVDVFAEAGAMSAEARNRYPLAD